jgi:GNAT superfamily N-acetyltransferase
VKRELPGGYELDDDKGRIDRAAVHAYVSGESYWARGRPRETMDALIESAQRVCGLYQGGVQVGFSRSLSDIHVRSYLADVYVLPEHRGRGLGIELVRFTVEEGPLAATAWLLHTADAHALYERFGFRPASERVLERGRPG